MAIDNDRVVLPKCHCFAVHDFNEDGELFALLFEETGFNRYATRQVRISLGKVLSAGFGSLASTSSVQSRNARRVMAHAPPPA